MALEKFRTDMTLLKDTKEKCYKSFSNDVPHEVLTERFSRHKNQVLDVSSDHAIIPARQPVESQDRP